MLLALLVVLGQSSFACPPGTRVAVSIGNAGGTRTDCLDARGRMVGPQVDRYPDGGVAYLATMKANAPHGRSQSWYPDGTPKSDSDWADGKLEGVSLWFLADGGISNAGRWHQDRGQDSWKFNEDGSPESHFLAGARGTVTQESWYRGERLSLTGRPPLSDTVLGNELRPCVRASINEPVTVDATFSLGIEGAKTTVTTTDAVSAELLECLRAAAARFAAKSPGRFTATLALGQRSVDSATTPSAIAPRFVRATARPP
ncbi:MAG: hypothetical protein U0228_16825 [Myxococcaceae bacterium]